MEYFILEVSQQYTPMKPINYKGKLDERTIRTTKPRNMPKRMFFFIEKSMQTVDTDIITFPCFLVSKEAYETIHSYDPGMAFTRILLFDQFNKKSKIYYLPYLKEIDCLSDKSKLNLDRSVIFDAYLEGDKIKEKPLFLVAGINCRCILIRLDLAESLLRRNIIGMGLRETTMIKG